jgi:hypothetical protein
MDGDTFAEESAALDELEIFEDTRPTVNDGGPSPVKDVVTDAAPAEADAPEADPDADPAADAPAAEQAPEQAAEQAEGGAAQPATGAAAPPATDRPPEGPRDEPDPPVTGDDAVDAATAEVADTAADPLEARLTAYERAHRTLQDRLADVEG